MSQDTHGHPLDPESQPTEIPPATPRSHDRIGPYTILEKLGEGGMGIVYVAEQTEPIRRRVALKVIKRGMDTEQVLARFEDRPDSPMRWVGGTTPSLKCRA